MTNRELFGVLVRWTGILSMVFGFAFGVGILGGVLVFAIGAGLFLFADAIVEYGYRPDPMAILNHFRGKQHQPTETNPRETQS